MASRIHEGFRGSADLALAVYLGDLVDDRRVLWLGAAASGGPERLARSAKSIHVLDPSAPEEGEQRNGKVVVSRHRRGPLAFRAASFDLIVVPDLRAVEADRVETLVDLRRTLADRGVVVAGTAAGAGGLRYEELFDLLSGGFDAVRMIGQAPLSGWLVVDFAPVGEPHVTYDGSLAAEATPSPSRYYAICGRQPVVLDPYAVIQLPGGAASAEATPVEEATQITAIERPRNIRGTPAAAAAAAAAAAPVPAAADRSADRARELERLLSRQKEEVDASNLHAEELEIELARTRREVEASRETIAQAEARLAEAQREMALLREPPLESFDDEHGRLEGALREAARRAADLQEEVDRRAVIVRDLVEELREARKGAGVEPEVSVPASPDAAVSADTAPILERAQLAEARRTEAEFRADELAGMLAFERRAYEGIARREAELHGQARGFRARLAEVEENREQAEGRFALAQEDLAQASERILQLERELADTREQFELELVRARGEGGSRTTESGEFSLDADRLQEERDLARAESIRLTALVGTLEHVAMGKSRGYQARIAELTVDGQVEADRARREIAGLRGESEGMRLRLADREAAVAALLQRADAVAAELDQLRERTGSDGARADSLAATLAARDALIGRLQMDLADRENAVRTLDGRLGALTREAERLREAVVAASDAVDQRDRLEKKVAQLSVAAEAAEAADRRLHEVEQELAAADRKAQAETQARAAGSEVLRDVREALAGMPGYFERPLRKEGEPTLAGMEVPEEVSAPAAPVGGDTVRADESALSALNAAREHLEQEAAALRDRIDHLLRDGADQEMLMRSLAAQLEERDDRVRALERRLDEGVRGDANAEDLQRELMELQERVSRLSEELLHERESRRATEEDSSQQVKRVDHEGEMRRLHELLGDRDAEVLLMQGKVQSAERDVRAMREAFASARSNLEELLGAATASGDPMTADRIGLLLRLLSRF